MNSPISFQVLGSQVCPTVPGNLVPSLRSLQGRPEEASAAVAEQRPHFCPGIQNATLLPGTYRRPQHSNTALSSLPTLGRQPKKRKNEVSQPNNTAQQETSAVPLKWKHQRSTRLLLPSETRHQRTQRRSQREPHAGHPSAVSHLPPPSVGSFRDLREQHFISGQASFVFR